jgi:hypothetical protein
MTFEERHAQIDSDPLAELVRRQEMWAMAPDSRGNSLDAAIVPMGTIRAAARELIAHRQNTLLARTVHWFRRK